MSRPLQTTVKRIDDYHFDFREFGAKGNGSHDDTPNIQACFDALAEAGAGQILIPPGRYITTSELRIPVEYYLAMRGIHRSACIIEAQHDGNVFRAEEPDGIDASGEIDVLIEGIGICMPSSSTGYGLLCRGNVGTLRDLRFMGGGVNCWAIGMDRTNIWSHVNVLMHGSGDESFRGNGIRWFNSDPGDSPFGFGDSLMQMIDITLNTANTKAISFEGNTYTSWANATAYAVDDIAYDDSGETAWLCLVAHTSHASNDFATDRSNNPTYWQSLALSKQNNILLNRIECTGGALVGGEPRADTVGVNLHNAARITFNHVDLENLALPVAETGQDNGAIADMNCYFRTFNLLGGGSNTPYTASGTITNRYFLGTDNFPSTAAFAGYSDGDAILPKGIFLGDANGNPSVRMTNNSGNMRLASIISGAEKTGSIDFLTAGNSPQMGTTAANLNFFINTSGNGAVWPSALRLSELSSAPAANQDGNIAYDDGTDWSGAGAEGFVGRVSGSWTSI